MLKDITIPNINTELLQLQLYVLDHIANNNCLTEIEKEVIGGMCNLLSEMLREAKENESV